MKVEVYFVANSIDVDTYEGEYVTWVYGEGRMCIFSGTKESNLLVASYPENRVVRVRIVGS